LTATSLAGRTDPFGAVLDGLSGAVATVGDLNGPIADALEIVSVLDGVLADLDRVPALLAGIGATLEGLRGVLALLDAVPFIDAVAALCTSAVSSAEEFVRVAGEAYADVDKSVIKPCRSAFDDLKQGLTDAHDVVTMIATTVPGYVNTLQILRFMAQIAAPLTGILKGSEPAEELGALLDRLDHLQDEVGGALAPVTGFLADIQEVVQGISQALSAVFGEMRDTMRAVEDDLQAVEDVFAPIVHAFDVVADAIRPIRWALDAIAWIFDAVVQPVIDSVLEATGLKALVDDVEGAIEDKLGIKPIHDLVKTKLNAPAAAGWQERGGARAAASGQDAWAALNGLLKSYNTRDSGGFREKMNGLIGVIAGTAVDRDKPAEIPPWIAQPDVRVPDPAPGGGTAAGGSPLALPLRRAVRARHLARGFGSLAAIAGPASATRRPEAAPW